MEDVIATLLAAGDLEAYRKRLGVLEEMRVTNARDSIEITALAEELNQRQASMSKAAVDLGRREAALRNGQEELEADRVKFDADREGLDARIGKLRALLVDDEPSR